jgi:hypothetical protein
MSTFLERARALRAEREAKPLAETAHPPASANGHPTGEDRIKYATVALERELTNVREAAQGTRNHTLNTAAYNLGQLVAAGHLDYFVVADALTEAGTVCGLGATETRATINSGLTAGTKTPRVIPDLPPIDVPVLTQFVPSPTDGDGTGDTEMEDLAAKVREHFPRLDWHALWADDSQEEWIVEPVLPARRLIALYSPPKIGKSLLMLEIAVAIACGLRVLGVTTDRPRRVLYVDFENDPRGDIRERLQDMDVTPDHLDNLVYLSYPRLSALDSDVGGRELLAAVEVYECEVVIIDTISRAVKGEENENDTWLAFYRHTGVKLKAAGIACIRLDHTGKDTEKGMRGGSAKYGDVDAVWRLTKVTDEVFQLDCTDHRMPIAEKTIVMQRENSPLRHTVEAQGWVAARDAKSAEIIAALDRAGLPRDAGRDRAREVLRVVGVAARNSDISAAIKQRKMSLSSVPEIGDRSDSENLSPDLGDSSGQARSSHE